MTAALPNTYGVNYGESATAVANESRSEYSGKGIIMELQSTIIWLAAAIVAVLYFARRRKRKSLN